MLTFEHTRKDDLLRFKPWFLVQNMHISDDSLAFQFMWHKALAPDYAFFGDCLILRELYAGKYYFYYPISRSGSREEELSAIREIESYCRDTETRLHFTNVPKAAMPMLAARYGAGVNISDNRRWRDYLYPAEQFKTYAGKRLSGQRNHVNKFKKTYPDWSFRPYEEGDLAAVTAFLREYEGVQLEKEDRIADEEIAEVYEILPHLKEFGMDAGILTAGGKIVAFAAGERCGDMMIVHIEKALRGYEGAYPMIAHAFALAFCGEGVNFLNRMDDAGDLGLRKSKLQYLPCEIVDKFNVIPSKTFDAVAHPPEIETERLILRPVPDEDAAAFARLASDIVRNRYWGYDWREDSPEPPSEGWFLDMVREDFRHRREMSLGIYLGETLVGETVLHRFGYANEAEIGVRLLPEYENHGYAREAARAYTEYAFSKLGLERVEAKCFLENERSRRMLQNAGMREINSDGKYYYFYRTPEM